MKRFESILSRRMQRWLLVLLAWNLIVYYGSRLLNSGMPHYSMALPLDGKIPLIPWTAGIYLGCYVFWVVNYILAVRQNEAEAFRFIRAELLAKTVCLICFLAVPTTMERPEIQGTTFWHWLMWVVYAKDVPDNLFPSIHCLVSWFCFIGVRKNRAVPRWYRAVSFVLFLAICVSTLTTRQHVLVDVLAGTILAELSYQIVGRISPLRIRRGDSPESAS